MLLDEIFHKTPAMQHFGPVAATMLIRIAEPAQIRNLLL
jgi:hypothetical protein